MPPPPAEQFAARIFLGPALRTQSDRRLVTLVRDGYETAFEEIVRRYRKPLDPFAASIVGGHSEDVTQDAFSKALLALRGSEAEIELRPWLYRIVRNTALNDLRDRPPVTAELSDSIGVGPSAAAEAERREEMSDLMARLRALPQPQRAAIVMRELEGLSHEEIAAALGVSGGAARQTIHRARTSLRDGLGMLVPLPLLRTLFDHGTEAAAGGALASSAAGGGAAVFGGLGAGGALTIGAATVLIAGSLGAGVAIQRDHGGGPESAAASTARPLAGEASGGSSGTDNALSAGGGEGSAGSNGGDGRRGPGSSHSGSDNSGHGSSGDRGSHGGSSGPSSGSGGSGDDSSGPGSGSGGSGSGRGSSSGSGDDGGLSGKGSDGSGSGSGDSGGGGDGSGGSVSGDLSSVSGQSESGSGSDDLSSGSGSGSSLAPVSEPAPESGSGKDSGSGSGGSGSGGGSISLDGDS